MNATSTIVSEIRYLEMEEEPPRHISQSRNSPTEEAIRTSSGLLLTHRRPSPTARRPSSNHGWSSESTTPQINTIFDKSDPHTRDGKNFRKAQREYFEVEHGFMGFLSATKTSTSDYNGKPHSMQMLQARRFLSYVRIWMVISAIFLLFGTSALLHSFGHSEPVNVESKASGTASAETSNGGTASVSSAVLNAQQIAAKEDKPIFIWAMDGHPLGCT